MTDGSGITLFYTPNLRPKNVGVLTVGAMDLMIPPGKQEYTQKGKCSSECTEEFPHTLYLTGLGFHMHYLGNYNYFLYRVSSFYDVKHMVSMGSPIIFVISAQSALWGGEIAQSLASLSTKRAIRVRVRLDPLVLER